MYYIIIKVCLHCNNAYAYFVLFYFNRLTRSTVSINHRFYLTFCTHFIRVTDYRNVLEVLRFQIVYWVVPSGTPLSTGESPLIAPGSIIKCDRLVRKFKNTYT